MVRPRPSARLIVLVCLAVLLAAVTAASAAEAPASPPILYVQGVACPAHATCTGKPRYFERIRRIAKIGFPSSPVSTGAFSDSEPAWSPDHRQIAFVRASHNGLSYAIWVMRADGTHARQLTHGTGADVEPSWSPDGTRLVFRGPSKDGRSFDLYIVDATGANRTDLTSNPDDVAVTDPSWSRTNLIAFGRVRQGSGAGTGIYTIRPNGTGLKRVTVGGLDPAWSPDGSRIAFVRPDPGSSGQLELFTVGRSGSGVARLTTGPESTEPAWSPDGSRLVFLRDTQITVVNADGSHLKQLTKPLHGSSFVDTPAW